MESFAIRPIARLHSDFKDKFGVPRQAGIVSELEGRIVFEPEFRDPNALRGLEAFSHLWLLWQFSETRGGDWSPTVRPPRLGGNQRMGVFATRSPNRPSPIGLSCVRLTGVELHTALGPVLHVVGADLLDGTPILDLKPYLPYADSHPEASGGFTDETARTPLEVRDPEGLLERVPAERRTGLLQVLSWDPRPSYHSDPDRVYGMAYGPWEVRFRVRETELYVCGLEDRGREDESGN